MRGCISGVVLLALALLGCERSASLDARSRGPADATYSVRGRVVMVPSAGSPTSELVVYHEPIPEFVNANGTKGMPSMTMPFPLKPGVSIDGVGVGDVVRITFDLWTTPGVRGYEATAVERLPMDTTLDLGAGPGGTSPSGSGATQNVP